MHAFTAEMCLAVGGGNGWGSVLLCLLQRCAPQLRDMIITAVTNDQWDGLLQLDVNGVLASWSRGWCVGSAASCAPRMEQGALATYVACMSKDVAVVVPHVHDGHPIASHHLI